MKRIALCVSLIVMTLGAGVSGLRAQTARPDFAGLTKKLEKSDAQTHDAKRSAKVSTWLDRGALLTDIASAHTLGMQPGWDEPTIRLVQGKPASEGEEEVGGRKYRVLRYGEVDLYLGADGKLAFTRVVKPVVVNPLMLSYDAYVKAESLDTKGKKTKQIGKGLHRVHDLLFNEGVNYYVQGKYSESADALELDVKVGQHPLVQANDTIVLYYTGLAHYESGDKEKAMEYFRRAIDAGYTAKGELVCSYYQVSRELGKADEGKKLVEEYVRKEPGQKCLMLSLVDYYISQGKNPQEALPYLDSAILNDPKSAQLYYVKGVVLQNMEDEAGAVAAYEKSIELKPDYVDPTYNMSVMYYNEGVALQKKAIEDGEHYDEYMKLADEKFRKAISPAERTLEIEEGHEGAIDILHSLYFKYRREEGMQAKLDALLAKYPKK